MLGQAARWGNSLGIRIPKDIARQVDMTQEDMRDAFDWGPDVDREAVE